MTHNKIRLENIFNFLIFYSPSTEYDNIKLEKSLLCICTMQLRRILIDYLQKLLYIVKKIGMSSTPTLNIYLFEGPILSNLIVTTRSFS
jgi:hypothetical protein